MKIHYLIYFKLFVFKLLRKFCKGLYPLFTQCVRACPTDGIYLICAFKNICFLIIW